jgi:hypothetical protein
MKSSPSVEEIRGHTNEGKGATMKILTASLSLAALLFLAANVSAEAISGRAFGYVRQPYTSPGAVLLLDSFDFRYSDEDHHLQSLAAKLEPDGQILLALTDTNKDNEYFYSVEHTRRADAGIITGSFVDVCNGSCLYPLTSPGTGYVFALRSFRFEYRSGDDQHVDQIGILLESDGVRTYFNDKNDDDSYTVPPTGSSPSSPARQRRPPCAASAGCWGTGLGLRAGVRGQAAGAVGTARGQMRG